MNLRSFYRISFLLLGLAFLLGCDQGRQNPPDTSVRIVHAAPSYGTITFRREESSAPANQADLGYKGSAAHTYDEGQYDFNIEAVLPGASSVTRARSFSKEVRADTHYTFVLTEIGGIIEPVILEYPALASTATQAQIVALHAGPALTPMDLYLEPAGTTVAAAIPRGSLAFGQSLAPVLIAAGDYELTLTEPGNPANVLLASSTFTLTAAASTVFVIVDGANEGTAPLRVVLLQDTTGLLIDKNLQSALRVINGATDTAARDFAINGQFTPPQFSAVEFATPSTHAPVPPGENTVDVTPAGNTGVLELTQTISTPIGGKHTLLVTGDPGTLTHVLVTDDERRIAAEGKLRFFNAARQFTQVDFLLVVPGTDASALAPTASLAAPGGTPLFGFSPGDYELVLRENGTTNIVAGPLPITLAGGGIYGVLAVNGADATTAGIVLLDDF